MNPERWKQVKSVFHQVLELAPDDRSSFLDRACSTDHSLRREVESLLSSDQEARSDFLASELTRVTIVTGTKIDEYEVRSLLGSGGMGVVYRARDQRLGREVAIKVLAPFFASDRERLRRFEQEAKAAAAFNHPNILAVHQLGTYEGSPYLVSELLEGETLRARIKRGPIPLQETLDYARQIARGLAAAHEKGIVHRDLKPENLFITRAAQVKILDFGLAKQTRAEPTAETKPASLATEAGMVMGTVGYMSPEQVRGQAADFRADIFAFGAILYEMVSNKRAFTGESSADVASAVLKEDPPRLSKSVSRVPKTLEGVIQRCLEKNPEQRFQSAEELSAALRGTGDLSAPRVGISLPWNFLRWRPGVVTRMVTVAALAAAVMASAFYFRTRQAPIDSIAVLPFASKGTDIGAELGDELTSGLIESLSQIPNLRVMSRSSVSRYKGQELDPRNVGRELNVRAVLSGTVMPRGDGYVLNAELVNAKDGGHIWGQQYTAKSTDALTLQAELASTISTKLRPRLSEEAKASLARPGTSNPEAYALYVRGRYSFDRFDREHMKEALTYFQQAVEKDTGYPQAYAGMADAYAVLTFYASFPFEEGIQKARAAARRALELEANLADGYCGLAGASYVHYEWERADIESQRCVELNPSAFFAHQVRALVLESTGKFEEAFAEQKLALAVDPVSYSGNKFLAEAYYNSRDYKTAIEQFRRLLEFEANDPDLHGDLANCYVMTGEYDKAAREYEEDFRLDGKENQAEALGRAYGREGFTGFLKALIALSSDPKMTEDYNPSGIADYYALLGDRDNSFLWLDRSYEVHYTYQSGLLGIKVDPLLDNIRTDPRYQDFLHRIGFPQ